MQLPPLPNVPGPFELKLTVPVGVVWPLVAVSVTVAVQVVDWPATTGCGVQLTLVEVGCFGGVVIRPILLPENSVNQSAPSGPAVIPVGSLAAVGTPNSLKLPAVVTRPILLPDCSVNQSAPPGPAVIPKGWLAAVGTPNSLKLPAVVTRPILLPENSVNQSAPSGPAVIPLG